jgi:hypothetical protein
MSAPLKSAEEITLIINRGQHALADIGLELVKRSKRGINQGNVGFRDDMYRLILLRIYLQNILDDDGNVIPYYSDNEQKFSKLLDAIARLSQFYGGSAIPLITGKRIPLYFFPSDSGFSPTPPSPVSGIASFENTDVDIGTETVDSFIPGARNLAFYVYNVYGSNSGEGSRSGMIIVNIRGGSVDHNEIRSPDVGGITSPLTFITDISGGQVRLRAVASTNNWIVRGFRII